MAGRTDVALKEPSSIIEAMPDNKVASFEQIRCYTIDSGPGTPFAITESSGIPTAIWTPTKTTLGGWDRCVILMLTTTAPWNLCDGTHVTMLHMHESSCSRITPTTLSQTNCEDCVSAMLDCWVRRLLFTNSQTPSPPSIYTAV